MLRAGLLAATLIACLLLVVSEFVDLYSIRTQGLGEVLATGNAGPHHSYALAIIAVAAAGMAYGAYRGSRPAAIAVALLGGAALLICLVVDLPDLDETGRVGQLYDAYAQGEIGFKLETAGAILLLVCGVLTAVLGRPAPAPPGRAPSPAPAEESTDGG